MWFGRGYSSVQELRNCCLHVSGHSRCTAEASICGCNGSNETFGAEINLSIYVAYINANKGIIEAILYKGVVVSTTQIVQLIRKAKKQKKMTLNEIASESKVAIRTVNRIFAGEDVRFSSLVAVLDTLDLNIYVEKEVA